MFLHGLVMSENSKDKIDNNKPLDAEGKDLIVAEEIGGYKGLEPTKYGDWQHKGRVSDF